jgi:hypothetical protein
VCIFCANDERMHHYQRERASLTELMVELREIIETGQLVVVVMTRLVVPSVSASRRPPEIRSRLQIVDTPALISSPDGA